MAFYSDSAFNEPVSAVTATNSVALGERRWHNGTEYIYVYNAGSTAAVGYGVIMTGTSGYTVTVTSALGNRFFGIVQNANLTTEKYGWIAVKGLVHSTVPDGLTVTALTGMLLQAAADGTHQPVTTGATGSTFATRGTFGYCVGEIATAGTGAAYVWCAG